MGEVGSFACECWKGMDVSRRSSTSSCCFFGSVKKDKVEAVQDQAVEILCKDKTEYSQCEEVASRVASITEPTLASGFQFLSLCSLRDSGWPTLTGNNKFVFV